MGGRYRRELAGIALFLFAIFLAAAIVLGRAHPGGASCWSVHGPMGPVGACLRVALLYWLGLPATLLIPLLPAVHALRRFGRVASETDRSWLLFLIGVIILLPVGLGLGLDVGRELNPSTGLWGSFTSYYVVRAFGRGGAWIVLFLAFCALTVVTLAWNPIRVFVGTRVNPHGAAAASADAPAGRRRRKAGAETPAAALLEPAPEEMPGVDPRFLPDQVLAGSPEGNGASTKSRKRDKRAARDPFQRDEKVAIDLDATETPDVADEALPPAALLTPAPARNELGDRRELDEMAARLKDALSTFHVEAEIAGRTTGPVVTQFEVEPAPGVKVRQIATLANDLALAMRAASIRIVAPIPGRGAVGVEVPNPTPEIVAFRELIEAREFQNARAALPIALGKDLEGHPVIADLAKMPHLLIAGATGSGKSVCINTLITSLIYRHTPQTLRFLMVDPKMVELSVYNALPHLRHKVITDNHDAAAVLRWAVSEMQERYELLAANGCRNVQEFNRRVQAGSPLMLPKREDVAFEDLTYTLGILPYIVVVIDELADLMMTVQAEVETPLAMLAQKARAIGVHLILATQRPSVNVITGLIKANFPSRIAFRVASQVDSRTIIDGVGAEALLGNGDMLFIPPGRSEPARLQGAFITSEDTERLAQWYKDQRDAKRREFEAQGLIPEEPMDVEEDILEAIRQQEAAARAKDTEGVEVKRERDKLFREAAEAVVQNRSGSTSLLQRKLKIGYGRAARIMDQLHDAGVLGPADGSKAREVLVGLDDISRICESNDGV
ncbi:MAG TPA: DNA translocase FtsK 4TM domain-containing protein [Gemmatimonadaceae bacterium]|nr:DNA translocase FtsK 4TM domain-containing protein [Gemmatimonadaceae bacterium]